jgi:pimeloyl-ACP methyl ester carboxylesterase
LILYWRDVEQVIDRGQRGWFRKEILVTPGKVPLALVRKRWSATAGETKAPVLLIHGFGQNRYAWHLPSRSPANHLARAGFDVYNLDLRGHGRSRALGGKKSGKLFDYVAEDLPIAIEEVQRHAGPRPVFLVGHSLGGLVSYAAAPQLDGAVAGIVSIGSPYHFTRGSAPLTAMSYFLQAFSRIGIAPYNAPIPVGVWGRVMRSTRRLAESRVSPLPIRGWHAGAMEPYVLDEHLRLAFDRAGLVEALEMFAWARDKRFFGAATDCADRFASLDVPLLVIAGANDDLAPPASVRPAFIASQSRDKTYQVLPLGHIDLLVGKDAPLMTWPLVTRWITKRVA